MAAPIGNSNAKKGKEWFDALRKECVQRGALANIAKVVIDKAEAGEPWAIQEVANRFDGKPAQSVELTGDADNPVTWQAIERRTVRPSE